MRQRISDQNVLPAFDIQNEVQKLQQLFLKNGTIGERDYWGAKLYPRMSYASCLESLFLQWELRGSFTTLEEMLYLLEISEQHFSALATNEKLLDYIQFVCNAISFVDNKCRYAKSNFYLADDTVAKAILWKNCQYILERLNAEIRFEKNEWYVFYNDDLASIVADEHQDLSLGIREYLKVDNRGDLQRKGEVLCTLAKKLEGYEKQLSATEFKKLCDDTTFLLNKCGIRHTLQSGDEMTLQFAQMTEDELEVWYDNAFRMILTCIEVVPCLEIKKQINEIRRKS